ncbi:p60 katanin, putative [Eimeria praecox]|uniref:p60 katanin, putative n=1 Tax=Eimeria praecox TaxID=51316 RepID=U6G062_9EIME|nr:p60 katanin, putative [Eimeria praecox]
MGASPLPQTFRQDTSLIKPNVKDEKDLRAQQGWGYGVGWRKLTERGRLKVVPSSSGYLEIDGCTAGFCIASYEGTKEEQDVLQGGMYRVEALFKVSPGGAFDGQAICILLDMAKAGDVSGLCDFCSLQLNTSSRCIRVESLVPGLAPRTLLVAEGVEQLNPHVWIHVAVHYASDSIRVEDEAVGNEEQASDLVQMIENELLWPNPGISFDDIVSLSSAKDALRECVLLPLQMPNVLTGLLEPPKGLLLFGPPGTGKTMLANAVASTPGVRLFRCSPATLTSKWRGESEKLVRALFTVARARAPSVLFFDEADALCSKRGGNDEHEASKRFKAELLQQIDNLHQGRGNFASLQSSEASTPLGVSNVPRSPHVVVVAATNAPCWTLTWTLKKWLGALTDSHALISAVCVAKLPWNLFGVYLKEFLLKLLKRS